MSNERMPPPSNPMAVARMFAASYLHDDQLTIRRWRGGWMQWVKTHWTEIEPTVVTSGMYTRLEHADYIDYSKKEPEVRLWQPNRRKIADLIDAFTAITHLSEDVDPPTWSAMVRSGPRSFGKLRIGDQVVSCANGLLDVSTRELTEHTPAYFNRVAVPFDYNPDVAKPTRWLGFLDQLWPSDPDSIKALQEFFGYVLSGRTDLQKIMLLVGPPRCGKGTIARVLAALLGKGNSAGPTLASLGANFGLSPLLGKPLAVVSDARLAGANVPQIVERLLSISGEDMLTVDRKYREPWTGKLPTRFLVLSNELPRFGDASGAIAHRFVVLNLHESFLGRENTRLTTQLTEELPGILGWALDGLDRLAKRDRFTAPTSSEDSILAFQDLVSPVSAFVKDACKTGVGTEVEVAALYAAWKTWCDENGHKPGTSQTFGRDLRAVIPQLRVVRPRSDGPTRDRHYRGIALSTDHNGLDRGPSRTSADSEAETPVPEVPEQALPLPRESGGRRAAHNGNGRGMDRLAPRRVPDAPLRSCAECGNELHPILANRSEPLCNPCRIAARDAAS